MHLDVDFEDNQLETEQEPEQEPAPQPPVPPYGSPVGYPNSRYLSNLLIGPVDISEKIDGSQFSFCKDEDGVIRFKSREQLIDTSDLDRMNKMFSGAILNILAHADAVRPGWVYRGEAMQAKRHNKLTYERVPKGNLVLFDINIPGGEMVPGCDLASVAEVLGCEATKLFACQVILDHNSLLEQFEKAKAEGSMLGGAIEGIVVKNYSFKDHKTHRGALAGKLVTAEFKESMGKVGKEPKALSYELPPSILEAIPRVAVWDKAVQHLKESEQLKGEMSDMPLLMKEINLDFKSTNQDALKDALYEFYEKQVLKYMTAGLAGWYKERLGE